MGTLSNIAKGIVVLIILLILAYMFGGSDIKCFVSAVLFFLLAIGGLIVYGILFIIIAYIIYRAIRAGGPYIASALSYVVMGVLSLPSRIKWTIYNPPMSVKVHPQTIMYEGPTTLRVSIRNEGRFNAVKEVVIRVNGRTVFTSKILLPPKTDIVLEGLLKVKNSKILIESIQRVW